MFKFCGIHKFQFSISHPKKAIPFFLFPFKLNFTPKNNSRLQVKRISQLKWSNVYLKSNIPKTNDLLDCIWLVKITYFQNASFDTLKPSKKLMKIWFFHVLAGQIHQTHICDVILEAVAFLKKTSKLSFMLKKSSNIPLKSCGVNTSQTF